MAMNVERGSSMGMYHGENNFWVKILCPGGLNMKRHSLYISVG